MAAAIRKRPEICQWVGGFYFMGGGVSYPDPVPDVLVDGATYRAKPSHNIRCDTLAAQIVFDSDLPMRILTNDVTTALWWDGEPVRKLIKATERRENAVVGRLLSVWLDYRTNIFDRTVTGTCPHDPLTVAEATGHSFVRYARGQMRVNSDASTVFAPLHQGRHLAGVEVEGNRFLEWFSRRVSCGS